MRIIRIVCPAEIESKLIRKHRVSALEARQALDNNPHIRFAENGDIENEDVYSAFGRTDAGRYLTVFYVYKPSVQTAIIISARDMTSKERKRYGRA